MMVLHFFGSADCAGDQVINIDLHCYIGLCGESCGPICKDSD